MEVIAPPAGPDPAWLSELSREKNMKVTEHEFNTVVRSIVDDSQPLYQRGLAVSALGNLLKTQKHLRTKVGDLSVMDTLIELIGRTRQADDVDLGCSSADIHKVRVNCCVVLSMVVESVAGPAGGGGGMMGEGGALGGKQAEQGIIPMAALPEKPRKRDAGEPSPNKSGDLTRDGGREGREGGRWRKGGGGSLHAFPGRQHLIPSCTLARILVLVLILPHPPTHLTHSLVTHLLGAQARRANGEAVTASGNGRRRGGDADGPRTRVSRGRRRRPA